MVNVDLAGGWKLISALAGHGFVVEVAFWARLSDDEAWRLYLVSPYVGNRGLGPSYQLIHAILRDAPEWGIDPFSVQVFNVGNPMAQAVVELVKPKAPAGSFVSPNPKPYRGVTRLSGRSLAGISVDGAFIYPPWEPGLNPLN